MSQTQFYHFLVICLFSTATAILCFSLGGIVAQVEGHPPNSLGDISFKTGGSLGGFLITLACFTVAYRVFVPNTPVPVVSVPNTPVPVAIRVAVVPDDNQPVATKEAIRTFLARTANPTLTVEATVRKSDFTKRALQKCDYIWEAGAFIILVSNVEANDFVTFKITDSAGKQYTTNVCSPLTGC